MKIDKWKNYIAMLLTKHNAFHLVNSERKGETDIEIYTNNLETTYKVGYIDEHLIFLNLTHPKIPGYNEETKGDYFHADYFDDERQSKVGLEFEDTNKRGIREIIENGLHGREEQFLLNNIVIYSKLFLDEFGYQTNVDFTNRTIWQKIFGPKIQNIEGVKLQIIELAEVFSGNK